MNNPSRLSLVRWLCLGTSLVVSMAGLQANPTGGQVTAGSATVSSGPGILTVNQQSNTAIINWQSFSIGAGELTKFVQPSAGSAVLNRVLGGQTSLIDGTLSANGQVYLLNANGIVVGPGGVITTGAFTASTRDVADADFLSGNLHFTGSSAAGVQNLGQVTALGGNVYFIGHTVDNQGTISAPNGTVGLAAGDDVLITQGGNETVFVSPVAAPASGAGQVGVHNSGTIAAAAAELKAANGNIYALAIQNEGAIRATTVKHQGGRVFLVSDVGTVENTGTIDASATAPGGQGGAVTLKTGGTAIHTGQIIARGGQGGTGGTAEISGAQLVFKGLVDLTAPGGQTGNLLLDPVALTVATLNVVTGGVGTIIGGQNDGTSTTIAPSTVDGALASANVTLNADNSITVTNGITWTSTNTLTLSTNTPGSTITINAPISGTAGGLTINAAGATDIISATAPVNVASFILQSGAWQQNTASLPGFTASQDFEIQGGSTFLRVTSGDGTSLSTPYVVTDVYGLQGIASLPLNGFYALGNDIDASGTVTWNGGAGFVPIGTYGGIPFTGTFDGQGHSINGLFIYRPTSSYVSLIGLLDTGGTVEDVGMTNVVVTASYEVGGLVGGSDGLINSDYTSGTVSGGTSGTFVGGVVGGSSGTVSNSYSLAAVSGNSYVGGLIGANGGGIMTNSFSAGPVTGIGSGAFNIGGLLGGNEGSIANSFWDTSTAGVTIGFGADPTNTTPGVTGATTAQLGSESFILANSPTPPTWDFTNVWQISGSLPGLRNIPFSGSIPSNPGTSSGPSPVVQDIVQSFEAYTANGTPVIIQIVSFPTPGGVDLASVDDPNSDGGAINDGSGSGDHKHGNIASGSSTAGTPTSIRLIGPGGISAIFNGGVFSGPPPPFVVQKFELIFDSENNLHSAAFGP